jgi:1-acyl-sn-glycerol-3-phosphate acyltransferase
MRSLLALLRLTAVAVVTVACLPLLLVRPFLLHFRGKRAALRWSAWVQRSWGRALLPLMGVRTEVSGDSFRGPALIVANHISYIDILVLSSLHPVRFVAKSEIAAWPLIGPLARGVGTLFIRQAERRDVVRIGDAMEETMHAGVSVVLFPEGKATRGERVEKLHSSLFQGVASRDLPCVAAALSYRTPRDPWGEAWTVCWWGGMGMARHLWRLLCLRGVRATVHFTSLSTSDRSRKEITEEATRALAGSFVPVRQEPVPPDNPWPHLAGDSDRSATPTAS